MEPTATPAPKAKSIVPEKYAGKEYKGAQDWVSTFITGQIAKTKTVTRKEQVEGHDEVVTKQVEVADGIDIDKLFDLAVQNHLDVAKYDAQRDSHGFAGRFRMTAGNMLRAAARKRGGLKDLTGEFVTAPEGTFDAAPTHNPDGSKIVVAKAAESAPAQESEAV